MISKVTQTAWNWVGKLAAIFAVATAFAANGSVWYVDAVNGDDGWDGTTAEIPLSGTVGPRKTLVKVMELASAGDTIYAAEGDYDSGEILADGNATSNRVVVKAGILLAASGRRTSTFISGKISSGHTSGNNVDAVRAVYFAAPTAGIAGGVVKGFTIQKGRTFRSSDNSDVSRNGGGVYGPGLVVDCDFQNNGCNYRGGNVAGGATLLRCQLGEATTSVDYELVDGSQACDTLFNTTKKVYPNNSNAKIVNCTFTCAAAYYCSVRNCLFLDSVNGTSQIAKSGTYWNSYSLGAQGNGSYTIVNKDGKCQFNLAAEKLPNVELNTRPLSGSKVIDAGDVGYYNEFTNNWTAGWLAHWTGRDYSGSERISGNSIDVGCCEWSSDEMAMHVDAVNGDDANAGSELNPKRTLAAAVDAIADPRLGISLIKAAAGTYAEGSMASSKGPARVVIPDGIKLEGAGAAVTFIEGAQATYPIQNGCGTNSLRCACLANTAILKGFTLRNGYAWWKEGAGNNDYDYSGGGSKGVGLVVDCVYSNNTSCSRGGNLHDGTFIRCYFGAAQSYLYDICRYRKMVDCVFDLDDTGTGIYNQDSAKFFNCTFINGTPQSDATHETQIYNSLLLSGTKPVGVCKLFSCMSVGQTGTSSTDGDAYNQFEVDVQKLRIDGTTYRPLRGSLARDKGDGDGTANYRSLITNGWSAAWIAELGDKDFAGGARVLNGRVDVGAGEFIPVNCGFVIEFR